MNSESNTCTCTEDGYSPECPQAFVQGGQILHVLNRGDKLKPRKYEVKHSIAAEKEYKTEARIFAQQQGLTGADISGLPEYRKDDDESSRRTAVYRRYAERERLIDSSSESSVDEAISTVARYLDKTKITPQPLTTKMGRGRFKEDRELQEQYREVMPRFEPMKIDGESLTKMTIGGYQIDLGMAAEKVKEILPLPAIQLPIIFVDDDLNFFHHFFLGMDTLIGRDVVEGIVLTQKYYEKSEIRLIPMIENIIRSGHQETDSEIVRFVRQTLRSTFDLDSAESLRKDGKILLVSTNLWGFQYIEPGMQCKESDIKMWLSTCYNHYRTIWFNTFKSAGIPSFAMDGVQARYEHPERLLDTPQSEKNVPQEEKVSDLLRSYEEIKRNVDEMSARERRRRHRKPESSGRSLFGR